MARAPPAQKCLLKELQPSILPPLPAHRGWGRCAKMLPSPRSRQPASGGEGCRGTNIHI